MAAGELGGAMRCLTDLNGDLLAKRYITAPERIEFSGADGWTIEGWLMKPRGFDESTKWPLVMRYTRPQPMPQKKRSCATICASIFPINFRH